MPDFTGSVQRLPKEKWGERPSVLDFVPQSQHGAIRDGSSSADATSWIQAGLDSLGDAGGGILYLPWGVYPVVDLDIPSNVSLVGDGPAKTILKRRANLPTGRGVLNLAGERSGVESLAIDGQVTTPQVAIYSSLSDPSSAVLTANSSVRIHPGAKDISLRRFRIFHSGGYAVHIDARTGDVCRVEIDEPHLHDNRSWLFGAVAGSEIYGSWTGGILAQADGLANTYAVRGLSVRGGRFRRGTGNQIWSHIYGFGILHSDFRIQGNSFEDIGRDGIMIGAVVGGDVSGNNFRRIGYVCTDDTNPGAPRWINGQWAVGLDTAGLTRGVNYLGNTFVNCYGAAMDLDGFAEGVIGENTVIVSVSGEPEYAEDNIAGWAGNYCYGAQTSNTNDLPDAARGVRITGNRFRNCGLGAIRLYAARGCTAFGNTIEHPAGAAVAPIIIGNVGAGDNKRAGGNTVSDNDIYYSPGSPVGVVQEDANGFDFTSADVNRVYGNRLHGTNTFEFLKHSTSGSRTAQEFASAKSGLTAESKNVLQREDGYWRGYWVEAGVSKAVFSLLDRVSLPGSIFGGPLWNISGNAVGGVITTGARTSSAFDDAVVSGKVYADGFLAVAATTFNGTEANVLPDTVGLIRYNATSKMFEQSTAVSAGARVWTALAGSSLSGLTAGRIPYTTGASAIADSANLAWNNASRVLTVTGATGTASIVAATSFIQAAEGFYTPSNSAAAIGAPFGGVTALSLISSRNDGAAGLTLDRTSATIRRYGMGIDSAGAFFLRDETGSAVRMTMSVAGLVTFGSSVAIDQAGNLSASATVAAAGVNVSGTAFNSLQVPLGGLYTGLGVTVDQAVYLRTFAGTPNNPGAGYGGWSHRSGSTYLYWNGSAWATVDLTTVGAGVTSLAGTANRVSVSAATGSVTINLPQDIHTGAAPTFAGLTSNGVVTVTAASSSLAVALRGRSADNLGTLEFQSNSGSVYANLQASSSALTMNTASGVSLDFATSGSLRGRITAAGLVTFGSTLSIDQAGNMTATGVVQAGGVNAIATSPAFNTLQTNGGMYAVLGATVDQGLYLRTFAGTPNNPGSGYGALSHRSGSTYLYWNGSAWATFDFSASLSGAVLTTTNQEVEGFKYFGVAGSDRLVMYRVSDNLLGIQTMLDGQTNPATYSYGGAANGLVLQPRAGIVGIGSVNGSYNLYVDGTLGVAGTSTFAGVVGTVFNSTASGAAIGFQTSNSNFQVNGNGVVSSAGGINVSGVNVISSARAILGAQLQVDSATLDSQVYVSSGAPRIALGDNAAYASRTFGTRWVMATAAGHFGLPAAGDTWLFTERLGGGAAGSLFLGAALQQTLRLDVSNDATFARRIIAAGLAGGAGLTLQNGWVDSAAGFFTSTASFEALKATSGGVAVRSLHASAYSQLGSGATAPTATSGSALGAGAVYWDTALSALRVFDGLNWLSLGGGVASITGTANQVNASASTGAVTLSLPQNIHTGATPTFAGVVATAFNSTATGTAIGFQTSNSNFQVNGNGVVSSAGGYNAGGVNVIDASQNVYAAALQTTGAAAIGSTDLTAAQLFVRAASVNGFRVHNSATPSPTGGAGIQAAIESAPASGDRLAFYSFGVRSGGSNFNGGNFTAFATQAWTLGSAQGTELRFETTPNGSALRAVRMTIGQSGLVTFGSTVSIDQAGNLTASATVQAGGVNVVAGSPAFNSLQSNGGVYAALGATLDQAAYLRTFAGTPNNPGSGYGALSHRSGSTYLYWNGSAWATVDLAATGGGVTSLAGTTNQVNVSASTGAVTLSLPQNIHTGASPTFAGVTAGAFSSSASGSSIAFQTSNFNLQVDGNGNISGAGSANMTQGYRIGGTTVIDSSRAAVNLASAVVSGAFSSQATGGNIAFQTSNFNFQVNGNGVVSSAGGINVSGFNVINTSRQFVGSGVDVGSGGISAGGYNVSGGFIGQTWNVVGTFTINGISYTTLVFRGGVLVSAS